MNLRSVCSIRTADQVPIEIELAGIGNRVYAGLIDLLATMLFLAVSYYFVASSAVLSRELSKVLGFLLPFLLFFGYHFIQEWLWRGKTIGKQCLKIRTVRRNGQPVGFWESFGRNLMRLVDVYGAAIGVIPILFSRTERRFGDFLAGTIVINDQPVPYPGLKGRSPSFNQGEPHPDTQSGATAIIPGARLTAEEYALLESFLTRQQQLLPAPREQLRNKLTAYYRTRLSLSGQETDSPFFLEKLASSYQQ